MDPTEPRTPPRPSRVRGIDLARFLAVVGMVVVHAYDGIVLPPLEAASPGVDVDAPPAPEVLVWLQAALTDRARPLFFLLAGVGVSLLVARAGGTTAVLLRRAAFLAGLGVLLALAGWSDLVLVFYGFLFCLAPLLHRLPTRALLAVAAGAPVPAALLLLQDAARDDALGNVALLVGELVGLFCAGLVVGRQRLDGDAVAGRLARWGGLLAAPGLIVLAVRGALDLSQAQGALEQLAAATSTLGLCLLLLAGCLRAGRGHGRLLALLVTAGGMPLTAYVGHALLFPVVARSATLSLSQAMAVAVGYLVALVVAAAWWQPRSGSGPVEALMRRASGPGPRLVRQS